MQKRRLISTSGLLLAAALAVSAIILINAAFTSLRLDLTEKGLFTLSDGTLNILESLEEPIELKFYFSRKSLADYPLFMNYATRVRDLLEEYAAKSGGALKLTVIEPEPFSEEEDEAVAGGLQGIAVNSAGDRAYFGLVGSNSTDDEQSIAFFQSNREAALEYDLTKLIYNLANPEKRVVGVITGLPIFGAPGQTKPWTIVAAMREFFDVRNLGPSPKTIDPDTNVLLVVHPKGLKDDTLFAIDQFLLGGGKAIIFVDPLAEADSTQPDPENQFVMPDVDSDLKTLLDAWGIEVLEGKIAGDISSAMRVQSRGPRGPQEVTYLPWLRLTTENFSREDFATSQLEVVHTGTAGIIEKREKSPLTVAPLIQTSPDSMVVERDLVMIQRDPEVMLQNFKPEGKRLTLAARLSGKVPTAFPDGNPLPEGSEAPEQPALKEGDINVILVADTDILSDIFWVRTQNFFGIDVPEAIANNGDFVINSVDNLSGSTDLINLRSRGEFSRPFDVVEQIRREAEEQFREQENLLQAKLAETERKIVELQKEGAGGEMILTPEQSQEIEKFREEQVKTRKELRAVQHELQKNIERLGSQLKFLNIGLVPLLVMLLALAGAAFRARRRG